MYGRHLKRMLKGLYSPLILEDLFPHHIRRILLDLTAGIALVLLSMMLWTHTNDPHVRGGFFIALSAALWLASIDMYFFSSFSRAARGDYGVSFEIGRLIFYADDGDLTRGFMFSDVGDETMLRLGFTESNVKEFLSMRSATSFENFFTSFDEDISVEKYAGVLFKQDKGLADFLFTKGLGEKDLAAALRWVIGKDFRKIEKERFWSRSRLGRIPGLGKNWAYGETFILERYGEDLTDEPVPYEDSYAKVREQAVERLESVLVRGHDANVIIVSDDEESRRDIVMMLAGWIECGKAMPAIASKRVFLLNPNLLIEDSRDKMTFEREFTLLLIEAQRAGNVILVIPDFSSFLQSALGLGSDVLTLFAPYIASPALHIVALDSKEDYHGRLASRQIIATHFEMIDAGTESESGLMGMLESEAERIESSAHVLFTYPALVAIRDAVMRSFEAASAAEKAKDILLDAPREALASDRRVVLKEDINKTISIKTGVPTGAPQGEEKQMLLNLDRLLHARVAGQDEAVKAISDAMKRSRAGVRNPDKPMGTFLFLGPTGVGKTETAKALADVFFGSERDMSRLDMSEYRDSFAMERLLGSFASGKMGRLPEMLREKPYGVLLLDEFEKTTPEIMNVFLRLLDEGVVTDSEGHKANAKNTIIIATSNAGSELIWDIVKSGRDLLASKQEVIDAIVSEGVFKPELLNRFDSVVLYHPLQDSDLRKVAGLMMERLTKRMREKGIALEAKEGVFQYLVSKGTDPKFGARPIARSIAEDVERIIAEKIIEGEITEGSHVSFDTDASGVIQIAIK